MLRSFVLSSLSSKLWEDVMIWLILRRLSTLPSRPIAFTRPKASKYLGCLLDCSDFWILSSKMATDSLCRKTLSYLFKYYLLAWMGDFLSWLFHIFVMNILLLYLELYGSAVDLLAIIVNIRNGSVVSRLHIVCCTNACISIDNKIINWIKSWSSVQISKHSIAISDR